MTDFSRRSVVRRLGAGLALSAGGAAAVTTAGDSDATDDTSRDDASADGTSTDDASTDSAPTYLYDAANTGVTDAAGPTESPSELWSTTVGDAVFAPPAVGGGFCYLTTGDGRLRAVDTEAGDPVWTVEGDRGLLTTPAVNTDGVYLANENRIVRSLTREAGDVQWSVGTIARGGGACAPALANDLLYTAGADGLVHAFDSSTGTPHWELRLPEAVLSSLAVDGETAYVAAGRTVYAVDATRADADARTEIAGRVVPVTREPAWQKTLEPRLGTALTVRDDRLIVGTDDGVTALNPEDGEIEWQVSTRTPVLGSPAFTTDRLLVPTALGDLVALDPENGEESWRARVGEKLDTPPVVADGVGYLATRNGSLLAFAPEDGSVRWRLDREDGTPTAPVAVEGRLYLADWNGTLTTFGTQGN